MASQCDNPFVSLALATIEEAIGIYDADDRLVGCNQRYVEWRSAIGGTPAPGTSWDDLVRASVGSGSIPEAIGREDAWLEQRRRLRGAYSVIRKLNDGRAFKVNERRMTDGGIAVVWTNVSDLIGAQADRQAATPAHDHRFAAVGRVVGGIMHDFNNTNAATIAGIQLLRRRLPKDNAEVSHLLESTLRSAETGAALANRLLSFGRQTQQVAVVHLSDVARGMADLLRSSLGRGIHVAMNFPPALPPAKVDPGQLEMAILNLAVNARDAMAGQGRLILAAREQSAASKTGTSHRHIVLSVTDSGPGMDDATLARALDPFFTTKSKGEGTGLGLPMVHAFAIQSGGKFMIHSTVGIGSTAEIWLPSHLD